MELSARLRRLRVFSRFQERTDWYVLKGSALTDFIDERQQQSQDRRQGYWAFETKLLSYRSAYRRAPE